METLIILGIIVYLVWSISRPSRRNGGGSSAEQTRKPFQVSITIAQRNSGSAEDYGSPEPSPDPEDKGAQRQADSLGDKPSNWWLSPQLPRGHRCLKGIYCLGYRIGNRRDDPWTARINEYKYGNDRAVEKAVATMREAAPSLFASIGVSPDTTIIIPVLGSMEITSDPRSNNFRLAKEIALSVGARFEPNCLSKQVHEPLHLQKGAGARDAALARANYRAGKLEHPFVLLVDDIVTRGATLAMIA